MTEQKANVGGSQSCPCPKCGNEFSRVTNSRPSRYGHTRRRECTACGERFTTWEITNPVPSPAYFNEVVRLLQNDVAAINVKLEMLARETRPRKGSANARR